MRTIVIANQKGGVGKTTTAHAMIAGLANRGFSVLGIDLDPQGNLSSACGADQYDVPTTYEVLTGNASVSSAIQELGEPRYKLLAANIMLASVEQELTQVGKEYRLREALTGLQGIDYVIVDTPPSLGILTVNAFTAANCVIIPTTAGVFAATGIDQLNITIGNVRKYCNPGLYIAGILFTRYNARTNVGRQIRALTEQLGKRISAPTYHTCIRSAVAVEEAQISREDIFTYAASSTVAADYNDFLKEFLENG